MMLIHQPSKRRKVMLTPIRRTERDDQTKPQPQPDRQPNKPNSPQKNILPPPASAPHRGAVVEDDDGGEEMADGPGVVVGAHQHHPFPEVASLERDAAIKRTHGERDGHPDLLGRLVVYLCVRVSDQGAAVPFLFHPPVPRPRNTRHTK
jgi:hypothetical protein